MSENHTPSDYFNVEALRLPNAEAAALRNRPPTRPPRHRWGEQFLKGPIPWPWLEGALQLPGRALHVALLLWQKTGYTNRRTVEFNLSQAAIVLGVDQNTVRIALRTLGRTGLVTIRVRPGRPLEVTLNDAPANGSTGD